jgi:geranylgeranyl diphosphate synthase type II
LDFKQELSYKTETVNRWLSTLAPKGAGRQGDIFEAVNYSVNAGGKRMRPVLALAVCEMLGGTEHNVMPFACALEYIHTYSLIHDDLPCMDDDDMRRGMPTCHIKHGEALALLAGDALLNYAFEIMSGADASAELIVEVVKIISNASGMNGMIGGQVIDIKGTGSYDELVELYKMKTGALIAAAAKIGVLSSGKKDDNILNAVREYAENLGIAFQIKDDLLDVEGDEAVIGKRTGHDAKTGKKTFVYFLGISGAHEALSDYTRNAKKAIEIFGERARFLSEFADYLLSRCN